MSKLILLMGGFIKEKEEVAARFDAVALHKEKIAASIVGSSNLLYGDDLVMQVMQKSVSYHLEKKKDVVVNSQFFSKNSRASFIKLAKKLKCEIEVHWFDMSISFLKNNALLKDEEIYSMARMLDIPSLEEGINAIYRFSDKDFKNT